MPGAGFYPVESGKISFRKDGNWYSDDERIENPRIALLFSRSILRDADGSWYLRIGDERAAITVEDTPYVVRALDEEMSAGFILVLNDGERERLDPAQLEIGAGNVLYTRVKGGEFRARFLRPPYYHLSRHFEAGRYGRFYLRAGGKLHPLNCTNPAKAETAPGGRD